MEDLKNGFVENLLLMLQVENKCSGMTRQRLKEDVALTGRGPLHKKSASSEKDSELPLDTPCCYGIVQKCMWSPTHTANKSRSFSESQTFCQ